MWRACRLLPQLLPVPAVAAPGGRLRPVIGEEAEHRTAHHAFSYRAEEVAREPGMECLVIHIDCAVYEMMQHPGRFAVVLTPNLFGDSLVDLAGVLQYGRGVTVSGNFNPPGRGVYPSNHRCVQGLAHTDTANPAGLGCRLAGTQAMADRVAERLLNPPPPQTRLP